MDIFMQKLDGAKPLFRLLCLDFDGTVVDGQNYKLPQALALFEEILVAQKNLAVITARAATATKNIAPQVQTILKNIQSSSRFFIAGANGTTLYEVSIDNISPIYSLGLSIDEIKNIVDLGNKTYQDFNIVLDDLNESGLKTFQNFLSENWAGYIPDDIISICRPYNNAIFTEEAKVTFVLPKDISKHSELINSLCISLGANYQVLAGDEKFVHITKKLPEDGKKYAAKKILEILNLNEREMATFGDMPHGNDAGLLSFPFSFTNSTEPPTSQPPYNLDGDDIPVGRVYNAIRNIIS